MTEKLLKWLKTYTTGMMNGCKWKIDWASNDGRFVLVHIPGGSFWSGMDGMRYSSVRRELIDITKGRLSIHNTVGTIIKEFPGRFSKKMIARVKDEVFEYLVKERINVRHDRQATRG